LDTNIKYFLKYYYGIFLFICFNYFLSIFKIFKKYFQLIDYTIKLISSTFHKNKNDFVNRWDVIDEAIIIPNKYPTIYLD
jgi:hypothetical protein